MATAAASVSQQPSLRQLQRLEVVPAVARCSLAWLPSASKSSITSALRQVAAAPVALHCDVAVLEAAPRRHAVVEAAAHNSPWADESSSPYEAAAAAAQASHM